MKNKTDYTCMFTDNLFATMKKLEEIIPKFYRDFLFLPNT